MEAVSLTVSASANSLLAFSSQLLFTLHYIWLNLQVWMHIVVVVGVLYFISWIFCILPDLASGALLYTQRSTKCMIDLSG